MERPSGPRREADEASLADAALVNAVLIGEINDELRHRRPVENFQTHWCHYGELRHRTLKSRAIEGQCDHSRSVVVIGV